MYSLLLSLTVSFSLFLSFVSHVFGGDVSCSETIEVTDVQLSGSVNTDFSNYVGTYYYSGQKIDDDGLLTPRYVHSSSGAEFNIHLFTSQYDSSISYNAVSFTVNGFTTSVEDGSYTFGETRWISTAQFGGEIISIEDNGCSTIWNILEGTDDMLYECGCNPIFNGDSTIDPYDWFYTDSESIIANGPSGFTGYYPVRIIATFDDCPSIGLSRTSLPAQCPDYSTDLYDSNGCNGDSNCNTNCFSWGCQSCDSGSFRMGWNQYCQDCSIIDNCETCDDYQGCSVCESGYTRTWGECDGFNGAVCRE